MLQHEKKCTFKLKLKHRGIYVLFFVLGRGRMLLVWTRGLSALTPLSLQWDDVYWKQSAHIAKLTQMLHTGEGEGGERDGGRDWSRGGWEDNIRMMRVTPLLSFRPRVLEMDKEQQRRSLLIQQSRHGDDDNNDGTSENSWRRVVNTPSHSTQSEHTSSSRRVKMRRHWRSGIISDRLLVRVVMSDMSHICRRDWREWCTRSGVCSYLYCFVRWGVWIERDFSCRLVIAALGENLCSNTVAEK